MADDADAIPQEAVLANVGGWRLLAMRGVPPITRAKGGAADQNRLAFLQFFLPRSNASASAPLTAYAYEMGRTWGARLDGYPAVFLRPSPALHLPSLASRAPSLAFQARPPASQARLPASRACSPPCAPAPPRSCPN